MAPSEIFPRVFEHRLGIVNVWFVVDADGVTLIDTGYANSEQQIAAGLAAIGKTPADVKRILVTHCHPDHAGSLAALQHAIPTPTYMHPRDAAVVRGQTPMHKGSPAPGLLNQVLYALLIKRSTLQVPVADVAHEIHDGEVLPISGGLRVIHTPGHSAGHVSFLLERDGGLLFVADACSHMGGLNYSIIYDDFEQGRASLRKLAGLAFRAVTFGHGRALTQNAAETFKRKWA